MYRIESVYLINAHQLIHDASITLRWKWNTLLYSCHQRMNYSSSEVQVVVYQARNHFLFGTIPRYDFVRAIEMEFFGNPKRYFNSVELYGHILAIWPAEIGTSNIKVLFQEVKWWLVFLCNISLLIPLLLGVYYFRNDSVLMTKVIAETMAVIEFTFNLVQFRIQSLNFQVK